MSENHPAIKVKGLSVSYENKRAIVNLFAEFRSGRIHGIVGPNGAGKSTLIKAILGLSDNEHGEITVWGQAVDSVRDRIAYVPQREDMDPSFPANIMDLALLGRFPHKKIFQRINDSDRKIARRALDRVGLLDLKDRQIGQLSGGQFQRGLIARAIAQEADLFLLDEPFVGVDAVTEAKIIEILREEAKKGKTILIVHHDLSTVQDYFDELVLLNQHLIATGPVEKVFTEENLARCYGAQLPILHKSAQKK
jgi:ABC-type Mn2+/Zn2+ transport system ATPase subunit